MKNIRRTLRACWSLFRIRAAEGLQYRMAALASGSISIFWALIEVTMLTVFYQYGNASASGAMTLPQAICYVWIAQAMVPLIMMGVEGDLLAMITSGDVGVELCRPMDLYFLWFAKGAATRLSGFWWRGLITIAVAVLLPAGMRLSGPASALGALLAVASMGLAFLLCSAFGMLGTALRLGITWGDGPMHVLFLLCGVLSGTYLPLQLWPDWMQQFLLVQPFAGYLDIPARLYVGSMQPGEALPALGLQLFWIAAITAAGKALMDRRLRNIIVQGG